MNMQTNMIVYKVNLFINRFTLLFSVSEIIDIQELLVNQEYLDLCYYLLITLIPLKKFFNNDLINEFYNYIINEIKEKEGF